MNEIHWCSGSGDNMTAVAVVLVAAVVATVSLMPLYAKSRVFIISRRFVGNAESPTLTVTVSHCHKILKQSVKTSII